jgi:hypothetical protein
MLKRVTEFNESAAEAYDHEPPSEKRDRLTKPVVARIPITGLSSGFEHTAFGNSDNQKGRQYLPFPQIARDDETPCVSPQRSSDVSTSRVLPFPSSAPVTMSEEERWHLLTECEPEYAEYLARMRDIQLAHRGY